MSRFFDQSQKTSKLRQPQSGNGADSLDIDGLVETSRQAQPQVKEAAAAPISTDNRMQLRLRLPILADGSGMPHAAEEAYRALRTRLLRLQSIQKIGSIAITSAEEGDGKTLTSINLALCYARLFNTQVLLVDGDLRTAGLTLLTSAAHVPGLADVLDGSSGFDRAIVSTNVPNLFVVGAGKSACAASELYAKPRWKEFMKWCSGNFKLVLVDSPPILGLADFELIGAVCDGVLVVVRARVTERDALGEATRQIDKKKLLGIVFNGQETLQKRSYGYYMRPVNEPSTPE
jgi:capsular exopolysaccharide synthesis family protein